MPITITPPAPSGAVGPFVQIAVSSDFIGPLPSDAFWHVFLGYGAEVNPLQTILEVRKSAVAHQDAIFLGKRSDNTSYVRLVEHAFKDGSQALTTVLLETPSNVIDSGAQSFPWQADIGQLQLPDQVQAQAGGGLTDAQAIQLQETHAATFTDQLLDNLTLIPLTSGPSQGPVNSVLVDTVFGVIVRLATVPQEFQPIGPALDYWVKTLCEVRLYRSADLWHRYPIHTSSKLISFASENVIAAVTALTATQWLLNMSLQVTFLPGVTGEVFLMRFP